MTGYLGEGDMYKQSLECSARPLGFMRSAEGSIQHVVLEKMLYRHTAFNKKRKRHGAHSIQAVSVFLKGLPNFVFILKQDAVAIGMAVFTDQSSGFCQVLLLLQHHWMVNGACWGGRVADSSSGISLYVADHTSTLHCAI